MLIVLQFYQGYISPIVRFCIPTFAVVALWIGFWRAGLNGKARVTGLIMTGVLLAWYLVTDQLARSGFYNAHWDVMRPLCWAIAAVWLVPLMRSKSVGLALDAIPTWWLVILQVYRAAGGFVWLATWSLGRLPAGFALPTGIGDSLVGIIAVIAAVHASSDARRGRILGIAWNVYGIFDFALGFVLASFIPYNISYPGVMIPAFLAPMSLDVHGLSLRQLARALKRDNQANRSPGVSATPTLTAEAGRPLSALQSPTHELT